jgi:nitroreductase
MELTEIFNKRRSYRQYLEKPVSLELIDELIKASSFAPVSCNLQLTQYIVVTDKEILDRLGKDVSYKFKYAPCSIIVLQDSRFSIERYSGIMSAGMAVENILLKAVELGLGTCPMAGFKKDKIIKKILNIPGYMDIVLAISVGYSDPSFNMADMQRISIAN